MIEVVKYLNAIVALSNDENFTNLLLFILRGFFFHSQYRRGCTRGMRGRVGAGVPLKTVLLPGGAGRKVRDKNKLRE